MVGSEFFLAGVSPWGCANRNTCRRGGCVQARRYRTPVLVYLLQNATPQNKFATERLLSFSLLTYAQNSCHPGICHIVFFTPSSLHRLAVTGSKISKLSQSSLCTMERQREGTTIRCHSWKDACRKVLLNEKLSYGESYAGVAWEAMESSFLHEQVLKRLTRAYTSGLVPRAPPQKAKAKWVFSRESLDCRERASFAGHCRSWAIPVVVGCSPRRPHAREIVFKWISSRVPGIVPSKKKDSSMSFVQSPLQGRYSPYWMSFVQFPYWLSLQSP